LEEGPELFFGHQMFSPVAPPARGQDVLYQIRAAATQWCAMVDLHHEFAAAVRAGPAVMGE
jgi:hypothetical protein